MNPGLYLKHGWRYVKLFLKRILFLFVGMPKRAEHHWEKVVVRLFQFVLFGLLLVLAIDNNLFNLFGPSPAVFDLKNPEMDAASILYSADGSLMARYYIENRSPVSFDELPPVLIQALLSSEDIRFYNHHGIDIKATAAAIFSTINGDRRGGSTLTQQLVKNLFKIRNRESRGLLQQIPGLGIGINKAKEYINAIKLEILYSKNDILTLYLNTVDFGSHSFGIKAASFTFFNKPPMQLKPEEAAVLVGLLKAPSYYSPVAHPENAIERRNNVLMQMKRYGYLNETNRDSLAKLSLSLRFNQYKQDEEATYFKSAVARELKAWCNESGYDIYRDGLKIYTTIDTAVQIHAEKAMETHMRSLQQKFYEHWAGMEPWVSADGKPLNNFIEKLAKTTPAYLSWLKYYGGNADSALYAMSLPHTVSVFSWDGARDTLMSSLDSIAWYARILNTGMVSIDPSNGYVKAWVGGIDHRYFKYDHVNQARRQPGSLFKAFVYSSAFEKGLGPCDRRVDQSLRVKFTENGEEKVWAPHNANWVFTGINLSLKSAFARSVNSVAVKLTSEVGWDKVVEMAQRFGIISPLKSVPSIGLGTSEVTLFEMVNAYAALANRGIFNKAVLVTKITTADGKILFTHKAEPRKILTSENGFLMEIMLRSGLTEPGGTTQGLWDFDLFRYDTDFGGKTGTSSNFADGWFIGVTPKLVTGVWVGAEHPSVHFRTSQTGEGLRTALPEFGLFMQSVLQDEKLKKYRGKFPPPGVKITKPYQCSSPAYIPENHEADSTTASGVPPV